MVTYMSPLGSTCTRASQDGLTCSCCMYTNLTNVPEESVESFLSFEADTENIPCIGFYFLDSITSSLPFREGTCSLSHTALIAPHTWLLVLLFCVPALADS